MTPVRSKAAQLAARQAEAGAWLARVTGSPLTAEPAAELRALYCPPQGPFLRRPRYLIGPSGVFYDQHLVALAATAPSFEEDTNAYGGLVAGTGAGKNLAHWRHRIVWFSDSEGHVRTWRISQAEGGGWQAAQRAEDGPPLGPKGTVVSRSSRSTLLMIVDGIDGVFRATEVSRYQAPMPPTHSTLSLNAPGPKGAGGSAAGRDPDRSPQRSLSPTTPPPGLQGLGRRQLALVPR